MARETVLSFSKSYMHLHACLHFSDGASSYGSIVTVDTFMLCCTRYGFFLWLSLWVAAIFAVMPVDGLGCTRRYTDRISEYIALAEGPA